MADPIVNIILKATDQTKGTLTGIGNKLGGLGKLAMGAAVGGLAALTGAVVGGTTAALNWGNQLDSLQDLLGTTAKESAGLAVMANRIGLSSEEMGQSLSIMTRSLLDVEGQAGPSAKAMEALGITIYDANGNIKDAPVLFQEVADRLGTMDDGFAKSSAMMDIFGRSGVQMGDLLAIAADGGVAKFQEEADKLGLNFSQEKIDSVIEFGKQTETLKSAFQGIAAQLGTALLPAFTGFLQNAVMPFVQKYGPVLAQWLGENIPKAARVLSDFWTNVLGPAIVAVWEWMSTVLIPFLREVLFPWLQENIPAALRVLANFWTNTLKPAIVAVWSWMQGTLIPFLQNTVLPILQVTIPAAIQILSDFWNNVLLPSIQVNWNFISTYLMPILTLLVNIVGTALKLAITALQGAWENVLLPALQVVWGYLDDYIMPVLNLLDGVVRTLTSSLRTGLASALDWVVSKLKALYEWLKKIKLPDWLTPGSPTPLELGIRGISAAIGDLNKIALPGLSMALTPAMGGARAAASTAASNRLTVYGGLHLHGIENGNDILGQLNDLMIG